MAAIRGGANVKDRIIHEVGRAIKQAQLEWCGVGCVRACTGRWLVLSVDAALLHGLRALGRGYWPVLAPLLDKASAATLTALPYATHPLAKGRSWLCLVLNEGQLEGYLHALAGHLGLLQAHYGSQALLRDPHRAHLLLMLTAGLEHLTFSIPMDVPGWMQAEGSVGSSSGTSMNSLSLSLPGSSPLPSPSHLDPYEIDTSCSEALEEDWASRKKRRSRSSSRSSPCLHSGSTTPTAELQAPHSPVKPHHHHHHHHHSPSSQRPSQRCCGEGDILQDIKIVNPSSRVEVKKDFMPGTTLNCDIVDKSDTPTPKYGSADSTFINSGSVGSTPKCGSLGSRETSPGTTEGAREGEGMVVHRTSGPHSARNGEKRVSFTDASDTDDPPHTHSLCGDRGWGREVRDLGDLRDLLASLKHQGLLPNNLPLDQIFASLDQSTPALSERAPPEGQEDPQPLHTSLTSLAPNNNNNNNNSLNDDSNNNLHDTSTEPGKRRPEEEDDEEEGRRRAAEAPIGCFGQSDIIGGLRWEELTKIGQEMLQEGKGEVRRAGEVEEDREESSSQGTEAGRWEGQETTPSISHTGTRPKQRWSEGSSMLSLPRPASSHHRARQQRTHTLAQKRKMYRDLYRLARAPPSLYIPATVDPAQYREEEERLNLEIAQGQSNLSLPGHFPDPLTRHRLTQHLFTTPEEKLYRCFSVREGHSRGTSVGVQVVLSTHALYVVSSLGRGTKPRHTVSYHDIHTIIVGAGAQWVCLLSKAAVRDDLATTGATPGIQLETGDPDTTHSLVSCLEVAVRRHFSSLALGTHDKEDEEGTTHQEQQQYLSPGQELLQKFTRECVDNYSNSLLEESLLRSWSKGRTSSDTSQTTSPDTSRHQSPAETPAGPGLPSDDPHHHPSTSSLISSSSSSQSEVSDMLNDASQATTEASVTSVEESHTSNDVSRVSTDISQAASDISQVSSDLVSRASADASLGSTDISFQPSNGSQSLSAETATTSSSMAQSLSNVSEVSSTSSRLGSGVGLSGDGRCHEPGQPMQEPPGPMESFPVHLQLYQQNRAQVAWAGQRWDGTLLDRRLPAVVVHPSWELAGLRRWLRAQLRLKECPRLMGYWLVDWEDGSSLGGGDPHTGPLGPTMEGSLMFRSPGLLVSWKPAYFILKAGVLYQFNDSQERLPHMMVEVVQCVGCVRLSSTQRPHAFQLLRKGESAVMLAAPDEHQASLWLQAFLTIINSGVRDISERKQVSCRLVLLQSGVLLAQQSDIFLGSPPEPPAALEGEEHARQPSGGASSSTSQPPPASLASSTQALVERKDSLKGSLSAGNLRDRKPVSLSSSSQLTHALSCSSMPGSPVKRRSSTGDKGREAGERTVIPGSPLKTHHRCQGSLSRLVLENASSARAEKPNIEAAPVPDKPPLPAAPMSPLKKKAVKTRQKGRKGSEGARFEEGFRPKGEVKVLSVSALQHLSSVSVYTECPTTCLLEFECSEAGEISGDWALYFRTGDQMQEFVAALAHTWHCSSQEEFPLQSVDNPGVMQFLLEGSQISCSHWSCLHL